MTGRRACVLLALVAGLVAVGQPAPAHGALDYVALGDSVASGYGLRAARPPCFRSSAAYPRRVLRRLRARHERVRFRFLACAGAVAEGGVGLRSLHRQVNRALSGLRSRRTLVTITIGINDLEWWNLVRIAALARLGDAAFSAWLGGAAGDVRAAVERELRRLLAHRTVRVVLTEYYDPLNRRSSFLASPLVCPDEDRCQRRARVIVSRLNGALRAARANLGAGARARTRVAPVMAAFRGHEGARPRCGAGPPGVRTSWIQADCFHANGRGARRIAASVDRSVRQLGM